MQDGKIFIHTDGAARGNPGPAAIGAVIKDSNNTTVGTISQYIGRATNNQAEYRAVISALEKAVAIGAAEVILYSDSELVVRQLEGKYRVKNVALRELYQEAGKQLSKFSRVSFVAIPREKNQEADALANQALDNR